MEVKKYTWKVTWEGTWWVSMWKSGRREKKSGRAPERFALFTDLHGLLLTQPFDSPEGAENSAQKSRQPTESAPDKPHREAV